MERMKTFLKYLILFVVFYLFTNVLTSIAISGSYKQMICTKNESESYTI